MSYVLIRTIAIIISSYITHVGVIPLAFTLQTVWVSVLVALALAIINHTIKPLIDFISIPINFFTLGTFSLVINGSVIVLASHIISGFIIPSFIMAVYFSVVLSIMNWLLHVFE